MKMKIVSALLLTPLLLISCKGGVDTSDWKTYENERFGFSLEFPDYLTERPLEVGLDDTTYQLSFMMPDECEDCEKIEGTELAVDKMELNILYDSALGYLNDRGSLIESGYKEYEHSDFEIWLFEPWIGLQADMRAAVLQLSEEDRSLQILTQGEAMNELLPVIVDSLEAL